MIELEDKLMDAFEIEGLTVPLVKLEAGLPDVEIRVGEQIFKYDRSYPIKGHSAVMPHYLREQISGGKKPLLVERPDRFYVYLATDA